MYTHMGSARGKRPPGAPAGSARAPSNAAPDVCDAAFKYMPL